MGPRICAYFNESSAAADFDRMSRISFLTCTVKVLKVVLLATMCSCTFSFHPNALSSCKVRNELIQKRSGDIVVLSPRQGTGPPHLWAISFGYKNLDNDNDAPTAKDMQRSAGRFTNITRRIRNLPKRILLVKRNKTKKNNDNKEDDPDAVVMVRDVHDLRRQVLQNKIPLKELEFNLTMDMNATTVSTNQLFNHEVMQLMAQRMQTNSTPGNRDVEDTAHLALAIEGGGMRGAVSAGMAAAIASLGLVDTFDSIYGSSAGCIVGAYMISRQMCVDVYTQVLPAAGTRFASRGRVMGNVGVGYVKDLVSTLRERGGGGGGATAVNSNVTVVNNVKNVSRKSGGRLSRIMAKVPVLNKVKAAVSSLKPYLTLQPGMNLTFVIEGIMSSSSGLRPFDIDTFRKNDRKQPLFAVASTWRCGKMETAAFGSEEGDFWDLWLEGFEEEEEEEELPRESRIKRAAKAVKLVAKSVVKRVAKVGRKSKNLVRRLFGREVIASPETDIGPASPDENTKKRSLQLRRATSCPDNSGKKGFYACLESSMLVPGAAGPPLKLVRSKHRPDVAKYGIQNMTSFCFDAFSYEAIPYRSAVENGATHVLALRSRPDGCFLETKLYAYEKFVAPVYFRLNGLPKVGEFFEKQGSQYRYVEDVLTLDEGLAKGCRPGLSKPVKVPPTEILTGTDYDNDIVVEPESWQSAHLLPVVCKYGTPELPALTQEKSEVVNAVRDGYVAAFDVLAPIAGLEFDPSAVDSRQIAEMMFPITDDDDEDVMVNPVQVKGAAIEKYDLGNFVQEERKRDRFARWITRKRQERKKSNKRVLRNPFRAAVVEAERENPAAPGGKEDSLDWLEAEALLAALPGFQSGKLPHLAGGLSRSSSSKGQLILSDQDKDTDIVEDSPDQQQLA